MLVTFCLQIPNLPFHNVFKFISTSLSYKATSMASKLLTSIFTFLFLFFFFFSSTTPVATRPVPGFSNAFPGTSRDGFKVVDDVLEEENCDGIGEEYCLMRKTLAAHADYIYTDKQKP